MASQNFIKNSVKILLDDLIEVLAPSKHFTSHGLTIEGYKQTTALRLMSI